MSVFDTAVTAPLIVGVLVAVFEHWLNHHDDHSSRHEFG
ncbi:type I toxin-antitoxin system Fst family toxin [Lacticaseibacillus kribbianus]|nr:type I toxin-antitoxin system Fst family toxin [Lacticaseibacillus kribbianus]